MTDRDVLQHRLRNQRLLDANSTSPEEAVAWSGAVQSQDYAGAKWAIGQRARLLNERDLDRAFDEGRILRTHAMRPTWHFIAPADIRWVLGLTAARIRPILVSYDRRIGVTPDLLKRSRRIFEKALGGGRFQTRTELAAALARSGAPVKGQALAHVVMHAELDAQICSGPRQGKQFTYALLAERAPGAKALEPDEALAELTRRYFRSHGPATLRDFSWWSGLTMAAARRGVAIAAVAPEPVGALTMWCDPSTCDAGRRRNTVFLLPNYDEYLIAHKDRGLVMPESGPRASAPRDSDVLAHVLVINGRVAGLWKRSLSASSLTVEVLTYRRLTGAETAGITREAARYARFLGLGLELRLRGTKHAG